ncbi:MAG: hypothetical protein R3E87_15080 [Burkholderiaceae bacterium]
MTAWSVQQEIRRVGINDARQYGWPSSTVRGKYDDNGARITSMRCNRVQGASIAVQSAVTVAQYRLNGETIHVRDANGNERTVQIEIARASTS